MITIFLLAFGIIAVVTELAYILAWLLAWWRVRHDINTSFFPTVCVIVPCKGVDKDFQSNVTAICNQKYNDYTVIFVTDTEQDPAFKLLTKIYRNNHKVSVITAPYIAGSSGKISALIGGIHATGDVDVFVFADADIKPHDKWLTHLVDPLKDERTGAATGYRWYFPENLQYLVVSAWNMLSTASIFFHIVNYTWGGSTAITRKIFETLHIEEQWKQGFSDDLILTEAIKKAGYKIQGVPQSIVESTYDGDFRSFLRFGTRQYTWVRWYYPSSWIFSVIGFCGGKVITIFGFLLILLGWTLPGVLMASTIVFEIINGFVAHRMLRSVMMYPKQKFGSSLSYALMTPVVFFIIAYNNLASVFKKEIIWGGRAYRRPVKK